MTNKQSKTKAVGGWSSGNAGTGLIPGRRVFGPIALVLVTPVWALFLNHTIRKHEGSLLASGQEFYAAFRAGHLYETVVKAWPSYHDPNALRFLGVYIAIALILMRIVPGSQFRGPITEKGHTPVYKANGIQCLVASFLIFAGGAYAGLYNAGIFYDVMPEMLSTMNVFSLVFCLFLYFKGVFAPSTPDASTTGNFFFDYYAGVELYPRILGWDVKQFTNCRFGMMYWAIAPVSFAAKQYEAYGHVSDSMIVCVVIQLVYVVKFFWWETGYFETIDIMHDRAGYMLCWGCMVWLPIVYTITAHYLVHHPIHLGSTVTAINLTLGLLSVILNYLIDQQRQHFRKRNGEMKIWGKKAEYVKATFKTATGQKETKLLCSGWWGICRKFNYTLELAAAFAWSVPAQFEHFLPYFYFVFLFVLLVDRAYRDDARCRDKYGQKWDEYCKRVPYMLIPGIL